MSAGDTVLVIGAAGGVGLEVTRRLLGKGHAVIATVLDESQALSLRESVPEVHAIVQVDLSAGDGLATALKAHLDVPGMRLAGVIHCAAMSPQGPLEFASLSSLRQVFEVNTISCVAAYQLCMPYLRASRGRLVLVSSHGGRVAFPFIGQYSASKFALEALGDVMRREAAPFGVRVVLVEPGALKTGMTRGQLDKVERDIVQLSAAERELYGPLYTQFRSVIQGALAMGTPPEAVADVIVEALHVAEPKTRYQVGQDAVDLVALSRSASDEAIDALMAQQFAQAAAAQG